jgi:hypothetical protein
MCRKAVTIVVKPALLLARAQNVMALGQTTTKMSVALMPCRKPLDAGFTTR